MKKRVAIVSLFALVAVLFSATFAWYHNNREVMLSGKEETDSFKIQSAGILQMAYADVGNNMIVSVGSATFGNSFELKIGGNSYEDITGNGRYGKMYSPALDKNGLPQDDNTTWQQATYDNAAVDNDSGSGQCVFADVYFRSDEIMDIYLLNTSSVTPVNSAKTKDITKAKDLANKKDTDNNIDYTNYKTFSSFPAGLPNLNINQSAYGLFSRNLIAGAARVSFTEYDFDDGPNGKFPESPDVIWVPNSKIRLEEPLSGSDDLYSVDLNGKVESEYKYYVSEGSGDSTTYTQKSVSRDGDLHTGYIIGELYRKSGSDLIKVDSPIYSGGKLIPSIFFERVKDPKPAIYDGSDYVPAAYITIGTDDATKQNILVAAEYERTNMTYAYKCVIGGATVYVQKAQDDNDPDKYYYKQVSLNGSVWTETGYSYTGEQINQIESHFIRDESTYVQSAWMDDDASCFTKIGDSYCSMYKIGSTTYQNSGFYYTRIQILVWIEGCDAEAKLALNGGEFTISLNFYGVKAE